MKILWVNPSFLDYRIPVYKKIYDLSDGNFYLIFSKNRVPSRVIDKIVTGIGNNAIGLSNEKIFETQSKDDFSNTNISIPYQPGLNSAITNVNADIIIGEGFFQWTPIALFRAKVKNKKFLISYERTAHTERNCPKWRIFYRQFILKFVDAFLVNGKLTKEYLIQIGVNEKKIFLGGMSADSENLVKDLNSFSSVDKLKLISDLKIKRGLTYLYVGKINEPKGVKQLLNAWKIHIRKYTHDNLLLIGEGPLYQQIKLEFSSYNSIKLLGFIDYDLIYRYYAISDVFIIPTLEDNWSLVVPEAMACGLPIACSIYNGCHPELVHEGINGYLFDPMNQKSIIEVLEYFHKADLEHMGKKSILIEKRYSAEIVSLNIFNACKTLQ